MTIPLLLIAAGGLAREVLDAVRAGTHYEPVGFIDDDPELWGKRLSGVPILGGLDVVRDHDDAQVVLCAGKGSARAAIATRLTAAGVTVRRYATVIHPSAWIGSRCEVGAGAVVLANVVLTTAVTVGRHCVLMPQVTLTHDNVLGDFVTIAAGTSLGGWTQIGDHSYLGMNASVRERVRLGTDVTIGMGAVVLSDVPSHSTMVGNPARPLVRTAR